MSRLATFIVACLAPCVVLAQTAHDFASRFMQENAGDSNLTCVTVGPKMLHMITKVFKEDDDKQNMMPFLSNVNSVRIINSDSLAEEYRHEAIGLLEGSGKRYTRYTREGSADDYGDCVWVRRRSGSIVEFVYVGLARENDFMVLDITGKLDDAQVDALVNNSTKH